MGRILGIDYGLSRVGIAISDELTIIAKPYKTLKNEDEKVLLKDIWSIVKDKNIEYIVLGLPISMNGKENKQTDLVKIFKDKMLIFDIPIHFEDERLSSVSAKKYLIQNKVKTGHNKSEVDKIAAAIFLQQHIDKKRF
tara:strand:- start:1212 stop:1625 length:414 start_codon:yes stop_codon:yes gene_type:complete